jgi:nucleoid-associated protein YgaU
VNSSTALQPLPVLVRTPALARVSAPRPPEQAVRITRRGRLVLLGLVVALAFALISLGQVAAQAGSSDSAGDTGPVSSTYVVQPGETLWVIAERLDPDADPRETVARIVAMNDLPSSSVLVGQELLIPA